MFTTLSSLWQEPQTSITSPLFPYWVTLQCQLSSGWLSHIVLLPKTGSKTPDFNWNYIFICVTCIAFREKFRHKFDNVQFWWENADSWFNNKLVWTFSIKTYIFCQTQIWNLRKKVYIKFWNLWMWLWMSGPRLGHNWNVPTFDVLLGWCYAEPIAY